MIFTASSMGEWGPELLDSSSDCCAGFLVFGTFLTVICRGGCCFTEGLDVVEAVGEAGAGLEVRWGERPEEACLSLFLEGVLISGTTGVEAWPAGVDEVRVLASEVLDDLELPDGPMLILCDFFVETATLCFEELRLG